MAKPAKHIAIIIPCFNEAAGLPQLYKALTPIITTLEKNYTTELILVDDGSTDDTYMLLKEYFSTVPAAKLVQHKSNRNLGAALRTGVSNTQAEYVLFLDSDCTYDPTILFSLLVQLENGVDLVTASPYHPLGAVEGVPAWRLMLSKASSFLYRLLLSFKIHTYTAMVRGMRRELFWEIATPSNDFAFMAETLVRAVLLKKTLTEVPTTLSVRRYGQSKMKIVHTIKRHIIILSQIVFARKKIMRAYGSGELT